MEYQSDLSITTLALSFIIICLSLLIYFKIVKPYRSYYQLYHTVASKYKAHIDPFYFFKPPFLDRMSSDLQRYGDSQHTFKLKVQQNQVYIALTGCANTIILSDSSLVKEFYQKNHEGYYEKSKNNSVMQSIKYIMGNGLVFSQGEEWKKKRKIMSSVFNHQFIKSKIPFISKITKEVLDRIEAQPQNKGKNQLTVQLNQTLQQIFGNIVIKAFFGDIPLPNIRGMSVFSFFNHMFELNMKRALTIYAMLLGPKFISLNIRSIDKEVTNMNIEFSSYAQAVIKEQIQSLKKNLDSKNEESQQKNEKRGITQILIKQHKLKDQIPQNHSNMSEVYTPSDLVEEFKTFFLAGTQTTSNSTTILLYYLAKNKIWERRVREQIERIIDQDLQNITYDKLKDLKELEKCQKQVLRMHCPLPDLLMRQALADHYIGQIPVKKGTMVTVSIFGGQYKHEFYQNPQTFDPDRWDTIDPKKADQYAFLPFSMGQRTCIGQHLAFAQAKIAVIHFLKRYKEIKLQNLQFRLYLRTSYGAQSQKTTLIK